jgi:hypothetical protein
VRIHGAQALEVIEIDQRRTAQLACARVDVARQGYVQQHQGTTVARVECGGDGLEGDNRLS